MKTRPNIRGLLVLLIRSAFCSVSAQVSATSEVLAAELNESEKLNELLVRLTEVKLNKALPVLQALEELGGETMLPLFQTMLKGDLYFLKQDKSLVAKDGDVFTDVFSGTVKENIKRME